MAVLYSERQRVLDETSDERFDRVAFAQRALDLVRPVGTAPRMTVVICGGAARMRVASGRDWRERVEPETESTTYRVVARPDPRPGDGSGSRARAMWAMLAIPSHASRRAIALAVAELAGAPGAYALDVLLGEATAPAP